MTAEIDVLVVGAGPAGAAAAIEARRASLSVLVVDRASFPRDKCCGDGLTAGALRHLVELGFDPATTPSWVTVTGVHLRAPSGRTIELPLGQPPAITAAVCRRRELDQALVDLAREAGATVLEQHELSAVSTSGSGVRATAGGVKIDAAQLIAADGMWSPTRKLLGLASDGYRGEWHAFRQYFSGVSEQAARELMVWFEADLLPGYAWSFPIGGGVANVGFGIQRDRGTPIQAMRARWPELLARHHVVDWLGPGATPEATHRAWPIPARLGRAPLSAERVLFVGDAATATDPMTGEGIGQALETGRLAAAAIAAAGIDRPEAAAERYRRELRRGMVRDHQLARGLSGLLARRRAAEAAIRLVGLTPWTRRNFGRWLFEDYPRAALLTPHRWSRSMLAPGGVVLEPDHDGSSTTGSAVS